ncbi:MAG TPA: restriction endonuclease, SacI family [Verrucomicrobiae bacterium]|jgi:hypothetical protein
MSVNVDHDSAKKTLERAWKDIGSSSRPPGRMQKLIDDVMSASDITFKYILVTGYLAKYVNQAVHARAIQVGSKLEGAYDARSLCHRVIISFEKERGNLFGLSNEPFVNKPARHPEHDGNNLQLRNKLGAKLLHEALEEAQTSSKGKIYQGLVHILRVGAMHGADQKQAQVSPKVNLTQVTSFIQQFLRETDGGSRLVSVWGAFQMLLCENAKIKVYSPNVSDFFGKTSGDVETYYDGVLVSASECKQRPLNVDDVNHGIKKAVEKRVLEYVFVISSGIAEGQETAIKEALHAHSKNVDLLLIDILKQTGFLASLLNPFRRAKFGLCVVDSLRAMRKFDTANIAADLWNKITG